MSHLEEGTLRRTIDEPLALGAAARDHLDGCASCRERRASIEREAHELEARFGTGVRPDVATALGRLSLARTRRTFALPRLTAPRWLLIPTTAVLVLFTLASTGLADSFLQIFEPKRFVTIPITDNELRTLPIPYEYGRFAWSGLGQQDWQRGGTYTNDVAEARRLSGLPLSAPEKLPDGTGSPSYQVLRAARMTFTFDSAQARAMAVHSGKAAPAMPSNIDGSSLFIDVGPVVMATYRAGSQTTFTVPGPDGQMRQVYGGSGVPNVIVVEARPFVVSSDRVTIVELRDYLLQQPGISRDLAARIRAIAQPESTLPVPVPFDRAMARTVRVNGNEALLIGDTTGAGSVVFWRAGDLVRAVGGTLTDRQVLDIAGSLR